MDTSSQPFKKPRLDTLVNIQQPHCSKIYHPSSVIVEDNENDIWDQDDITAEEFDMLQSQVDSQAIEIPVQMQISQPVEDDYKSLKKRRVEDNQMNETFQDDEIEQLKELQFAQEGQIKMLKTSLSTTSRELDFERLHREDLVQQRIQQYKTQEAKFQKQLYQLQTELQFKEQEMRASHEKIASLEQKIRQNLTAVENNCAHTNLHPKHISPRVSPVKISPNKFVNRFSFPNGCQKFPSLLDAAVQTERTANYSVSRDIYLNVSCSKGLVTGSALVSKILCNQMSCVYHTVPSYSNKVQQTRRMGPPLFFSGLGLPDVPPVNEGFTETRLGLARLNAPQCLGTNPEVHLFPYVENCLQQYLKSLHVLASQGRAVSPSLTWSHATSRDGASSSSLYTSSSDTNFHGLQTHAASALCDLVKLLSMRSTECACGLTKEGKAFCFCTSSQKFNRQMGPEMKGTTPNSSVHISKGCVSKESLCRFQSLASLLVTLSNPLFSGNDCVNQNVVQWSILSLLTLSACTEVKLESYLPQLNLRDFVSGICGLEAAYLALQFLHGLLPLQSPGMLLHSCTEPCVFNSLTQLCHQIHTELRPQQATEMLIVVINFLSQVMACHGISVLSDGQCACSAEWLQAVISSLWGELQSFHKNHLPRQLEALNKGASFLAQIAFQLDNFQECRKAAENNYVNLVCGLTILCKKYRHLRQLAAAAQELWDFGQDETDEFLVGCGTTVHGDT